MVRNTKRPEGSGRRYALNMKTTAEVRGRLETLAKQSGRSLTLEVEQQLIRSFEMADRIAFLEDALAAFGDDPHEVAAVKAFAGILRATQKRHGKSWREGDCIPWVVTEATRRLMVSQVRSPHFEPLSPFKRPVETEAEAQVMGEVAEGVFAFPPLPKVAPQDNPQDWTGRGRHVVTFKNKATGEVLDTVVAREGDWEALARVPSSPEFLALIERYRPKRDEIDAESSFVHVLKSEQSIWDAAPAQMTGPEEASQLMKGQPSAIKNRPAELFDRADFDEALKGKPRDDDEGPRQDTPAGNGSSGGAVSPTPMRRRKVKA